MIRNGKMIINDAEIIEISIAEKRIVLTRDIGILKNKKITRGRFVRSDNPQIQKIEVLKNLTLPNL